MAKANPKTGDHGIAVRDDFDASSLPATWTIAGFDQTIVKGRIKIGKVQASDYLPSGTYPIVDQGQKSIAGYSNDATGVYEDRLPVIVFGDHTRIFKYVDFPFVAGADGTQILLPNDEEFHPRFLFYAYCFLSIPSRGYNRHFTLLKQKRIPKPPIEEQRAIAGVLRTVQRATEATEKLISAARQLKQSLMRHLFTYGPVSFQEADQVELQETAAGTIRVEWEVTTLGNLFSIKHGYAFKSKFFNSNGDLVLLTPGHFYDEGGFRDQKEKTKYYTGEVPDGYLLKKGDLLVAMTEQSPGLLGSPVVIPDSNRFLHNQRLGLVQGIDESRTLSGFLFHLFNTPTIRNEISSNSTGTKVKHTSPTKIGAISALLPSVREQEQITTMLDTVGTMQATYLKRMTALEILFESLLHELMTGQRRVHDLGLAFTEEEAA
ncbi:MAG: restriction endonuclease subunit S [Planctomycetaceae bacterium]